MLKMIFPCLQYSLLLIRKDLFLVDVVPEVLNKHSLSFLTAVPLQTKSSTLVFFYFPFEITKPIVSPREIDAKEKT